MLEQRAHSVLADRLITRIEVGLSSRRPCKASVGVRVIRPDRTDAYIEADIAATCTAIEFGRQAVEDPFLIVEILSPSTERHDRRVKLPIYRQIAMVKEILFIATDGLYADLYRRSGAQWITEILQDADARVSLTSVGIEIPLGDLYEGIAFAEAED